jgi:hypothetical protein
MIQETTPSHPRYDSPLQEPGRRKRHRTLPGVFPTSKTPRGFIRTRLPLMMDGLVHIDTDPLVSEILPYAEGLRFWARDGRGNLTVREHVPDLKLVWTDGSIAFIDYVPLEIQAEMPSFATRKASLKVSCGELGASYAVHDELSIYREPRHSNLTVMWRHRLDGMDDQAVMAVRKAILRVGLPSSIGTISRVADLRGMRMEWDRAGDIHHLELIDVDRAFSAIMQLALDGEVEVDISRSLSSSTVVSERGGQS